MSQTSPVNTPRGSGSAFQVPTAGTGWAISPGDDALSHIGMRAAFHVCCLLYFGTNLSVPPIISMTASGVLAMALILTSGKATAIAERCWPLYVMCAVAGLSAVWSVDPAVTLRRSLQLFFACLLGIALVGRLGSVEAIRLITRTMVLACLLSIVWVLLHPDYGIHQATDSGQTVHAGLWRGVFSHKVSLGIHSGLTMGLLLFYGARVFTAPLFHPLALGCVTACLVGSGSATGIAVAGALFGVLHFVRIGAARPPAMRRKMMRLLVLALVGWMALTVTGILNELAFLLGRSADLTGRSTYWPFVLDFINNGSFLIGYGYGAGFRYVGTLIAEAAQLALGEAHNGYIEMIVAFGYAGGCIVIGLHLLLFWKATRLLLRVSPDAVKVAAFPLGIITVLLWNSYIESLILAPAGVYAILLPIAVAVRAEVGMAMQHQRQRDRDAAVREWLATAAAEERKTARD